MNFSPRIANSLGRSLLLTALLALPCAARAADPAPLAPAGNQWGAPGMFVPPPPPPKPTAEDGKKLLDVWRIYKAGKAPLDLMVEKATLEEIVAQISKQLPAPAPKIEIRDAKPIRLSFALKNSTAWEALETAGSFADVKLWSLPDRLLLAPQDSLTSTDWGNVATLDTQRVFPSLLVDEITAKMKGQTQAQSQPLASTLPQHPNGIPVPVPGPKITFDMLSLEGKEMLQCLVDSMNASNRNDVRTILPGEVADMQQDLVLSPGTIVQVNEAGAGSRNGSPVDFIGIREGNQSMGWSTDGSMSHTGRGRPLRSNSGSGAALPPLDLSAKKS